MAIDFEKTRACLQKFNFTSLFVEELGWSHPSTLKAADFSVKTLSLSRKPVAELAGVVVFEILAADGKIPDTKTRAAVHREIAKSHHEHLLIFLDGERSQSLWSWVKRQDRKSVTRDHLYCQGQPGDLFLGKLSQIVFDLSDFDEEGKVGVVEVANRLRAALDVERVTKRFFKDYQKQHDALLDLIEGLTDERMRRWYASVLLNRLMFTYFLQRKPPGFLDGGNLNYLRDKLAESKKRGPDRFFSELLQALFFEGFAKPEDKRDPAAKKLIGRIKYLNGGLFLRHAIELKCPKIRVPDGAFEALFDLFDEYSWNLDDTPRGKDDEINPDVLGYIFEKYINQKAFGAYYTRPEITEYLCERTIHRLVLDAVNTPEVAVKHPIPGVSIRRYQSVGELILDLDALLCERLVKTILPGLSLLDPASGSGAFLVAAMKTLINLYAAVIGKITFLGDRGLTNWLSDVKRDHPNISYFIKKSIITDNLFGVDLMEEAAEIARLRLFLALVASAQSVDHLEPLPNIDFNILPGNSLVGLMRVDDDFKSHTPQLLFHIPYSQVLQEKNRLIDNYRHAVAYAEDLTSLRESIESKKREAYESLNDILLEDMNALDIRYEQATWDADKNKLGKPIKRSLTSADLEALHPFHWGYEFDEILHKRGGFDAILANPPWEIFKPNGKEFFEQHSDLVSKKKMSIEDFEKEQAGLLKDADIRAAWLDYLSQFPHQSAWFRKAVPFRHQSSVVAGKKTGSDINYYKLFLEQCYNLLKPSGQCGIIIPTGFYTDLGAKGLRELLFDNCTMDSNSR